jgi:protein-S-isoprenylcysteine O-methyltransferase Ste14
MFWRLAKTTVFSIVVPGSVGLLLPRLLLNPRQRWQILPAAQQAAGAAFIVAGVLIYLWCAWDFVVRGLGTPAPIDAPKKLVVNGLYRYTRNPMYVGVAAIILGQTVYYGSLPVAVYLFLIGALFHMFVLLYEEPTLRRTFGEPYEEYCRSVPRWLPHLSRMTFPQRLR